MKGSLASLLGIAAFAGGLLYVRQQRRAGAISNARDASQALAISSDAVTFRWEYESCPPENQATYAEWTRRLADAKVASSRASEILGSHDEDVALVNAAIHNQTMAMMDKQLKCLQHQGDYLDRLAVRRK